MIELTRRAFLGQSAGSLGSPGALTPAGRRRVGAPALRPQGQARGVPVPVRRAVAHRPVRLQAGHARAPRPGAPRVRPRRAARDGDDRRAEELPGAGAALRVQAARGERRLGQRADAVDGAHRGQAVLPQGGAHRGDQPRPRDHHDQHGRHAAGARRAWAHGSATGWGARTGTCRRTWCSSPRARARTPGQPLFSRLWGSGFLPPSHQGVQLRPGANPVLYLQNPPGVDAASRRALLDDLAKLNGRHADATGDPEARTRIDQYEMAFRMQTSVPDPHRPLQRA